MYGRRPIYIVALGLFLLFVFPCAIAENIETLLVTRFFGAFCASAMISNAPGSVNDIVEEEYRALAFSIWSIGPINGPVIGPVVGGGYSNCEDFTAFTSFRRCCDLLD